ncbi:HpcH/HpaI aldolase family protein [Pedobacter heparinus]|uniref:HpcH/HpaI aldolase family protein n=1 Tax=Pedobacter heparinus TaxID=984 RepID=UPI0029306951|nr:aldolase/citrate lyase family protein [Pedobacter heparinus]
MKMRTSRVLAKLRSGNSASCLKVNIGDGQAAEIAAIAGFDCLWIDQEHLAQDWSVLNAQIWAAKSRDVDVMVRVPRGSYSGYVKPLEMDAAGILVPHIMNLEEAKQVVQMTRFYPVGKRAIDGGSADGAYTNMDFHAYLRDSNEQKFVILQIEDPEVLPDIDAIAALDGVDGLFFGPGDFSQGIGAPGEWGHPRLIEARKLVAEVANKYGKIAATSGSIDSLDSFLEMGYRFVNVGADVVGLSTYCKGLIDRFAKSSADQSSGKLSPGKPY